jgi:nucleoside 2-deoxyribosyltransferase
MMRFGTTKAHNQITDTIKQVLGSFGIHGLRADDKQYNDDVFGNIRTYLHGCGFGIAVFERLEKDDFNPNVSLEVGYLLALGKPVLLLKDKTLQQLHTDLVGKLYRVFDPQDIASTIPSEVQKWLKDKGLVPVGKLTNERG